MLYPLTHPPSSHIVIPGNIRDLTAEVLLSIDSYTDLLDATFPLQDLPEYSLPQVLLSMLKQCPVDLHVPLASNILITGGGADMPGFMKRLQEELHALRDTEPYFIGPAVKFNFHITDKPPGIIGWCGAAIVASCQEAYEQRCLTKERYTQQKGCVNDWLSGDKSLLEKIDYSFKRETQPKLVQPYTVSGNARARSLLQPKSSAGAVRHSQQRHPSGEKMSTSSKDNIAKFFQNLSTGVDKTK